MNELSTREDKGNNAHTEDNLYYTGMTYETDTNKDMMLIWSVCVGY